MKIGYLLSLQALFFIVQAPSPVFPFAVLPQTGTPRTSVTTMSATNANDDEFEDEFGDPSFLMEVDLDAISAAAAAGTKPPQSQSTNNEESPTAKKRRKISISPKNQIGVVTTSQAAAEETLQNYFGYPSFRSGQWDAIQTILNEQRDVAVYQSTGSGKSIMYQIPGLHSEKVVIVISPLISLMQDQVHKLNGLAGTNDESKNVATFLGSGQVDASEEQRALNGEYTLVYVTPEKLLSGNFLDRLHQMHTTKRQILMFAIDEAHCVSEWGHDFRKEFRQIGNMLRHQQQQEDLVKIPMMALTATAVPRVQQDIIKSLNLNNPKVVLQSFDRTNLIISVHKKARNMALESAMQPLLNSLVKKPESTIVYASTRDLVESIASFLQQRLDQKGAKDYIKVEGYHAGLPLEVRNEAHTNFLTGRTTVIVATVAFGMGIDKPDTRRVIHYGPPKTVEEYYQQVNYIMNLHQRFCNKKSVS